MKIKLNSSQKEYLFNTVIKNNQLLNMFENVIQVNKVYFIDIKDEDLDVISDLCCEMLDVKGFDENYELTSEGEILETLIDLFYISHTARS